MNPQNESIFLVFAVSLATVRLMAKSTEKTNSSEKRLEAELAALRDYDSSRKIRKLGLSILLPSTLTILRLLNLKNYLLTFWKVNDILVSETKVSRKIVIFAIYEKETIRDDIKKALEELSELDASIILVNTRKLSQKNRDEISKLVWTYIERPNYGRDFGSYKDGFLWLYKNQKQIYLDAERLFFLNDSVFFSRMYLQEFFTKLLSSSRPVLGATVNYHDQPHVGSFCISFGSSVFKNVKFIRYWKRYHKTDLRTRTIKYGELGLGKLSSRLSAAEPPLSAIFNGSEITARLCRDEELLRNLHNAGRRSARIWQGIRPSLRIEKIK